MITGASSGIGRATALAFAERGAAVVLAARSENSLAEAARQCEQSGGHALPVVTDVTDEAAVRALARRAAQHYGRIDVWVNAAAVIAFGTFEELPSDVYRQVIETNLFGQIHGARAALLQFRSQGDGVLVNVASVWGAVTAPYVSSYVVSKFGVRALSECLREALAAERLRNIHVTTVLPQSVDTPIFRHAANYTGRRVRPVPPLVDPERVARAIVRVADHPRRQRTVAWWGRALELGHMLAPALYQRLVPWVMNAVSFRNARADTHTGNVFAPMPELNRIRDGWRRGVPAAMRIPLGRAGARHRRGHPER